MGNPAKLGLGAVPGGGASPGSTIPQRTTTSSPPTTIGPPTKTPTTTTGPPVSRPSFVQQQQVGTPVVSAASRGPGPAITTYGPPGSATSAVRSPPSPIFANPPVTQLPTPTPTPAPAATPPPQYGGYTGSPYYDTSGGGYTDSGPTTPPDNSGPTDYTGTPYVAPPVSPPPSAAPPAQAPTASTPPSFLDELLAAVENLLNIHPGGGSQSGSTGLGSSRGGPNRQNDDGWEYRRGLGGLGDSVYIIRRRR